MKRNIAIMVITIIEGLLSIVILQAQAYYYYKGEKVPLGIKEGKVVMLQYHKMELEENSKEILDLSKILKERELIFERYKISILNLKKIPLYEINDLEKQMAEQKRGQIMPLYTGTDGEELIPIGLLNIRLRKQEDSLLFDTLTNRFEIEKMKGYEHLPLWYTFQITEKTKKTVVDLANEIYEMDLFASVYPEFLSGTLNFSYTQEPEIEKQWGLQNDSLKGIDISICEAWQWATGKDINIAVVDCGIDKNHFDLKENIHPLSFDAETGTFPSQLYGKHGTHCAGIAVASVNGRGVVGVAPDAKLIAVSFKIFNSLNIANSINWAWKNGADILSCSWQTVSNDAISEALDSALTNGRDGKGTVVVFSAGNYLGYDEFIVLSGGAFPVEIEIDNHYVKYPANYRPEILAVGAIEKRGIRFFGSCYGTELDVCAPGRDIYSTLPNDSMGFLSGTSMAAPHVAGIAALILEMNPDLTGQEVRNIIEKSTKKIGEISYNNTSDRYNGVWNEKYGYGLVDAYTAVKTACPVTEYAYKTITKNTDIRGCRVEIHDVLVKKGAKLTVNATKSVIFGSGFKMEDGAELEVVQ